MGEMSFWGRVEIERKRRPQGTLGELATGYLGNSRLQLKGEK